MALIRVSLPTIVGGILIWAASQSWSVLLLGGGIGMLVVAFAIRRRVRLGYVLGLILPLGLIGLGVWEIKEVLPHINDGPWNFVPIFIFFAGIVILLSLGYLAVQLRSRGSFATTWQPLDRRIAISFVTIAFATVALQTAFNTAVAAVEAGNEARSEDAEATVRATGFDVRVMHVTMTTSDGVATPVVASMTLEIDLSSAQPYDITGVPTLCLTDEATFHDEAYKPGVVCWGVPGPADSLRPAFGTLTVPAEKQTITIELIGAGSPCVYGAGTWNAELSLAPSLAGGTGGNGAIEGAFSRNTTFVVTDPAAAGAPPTGDTVPEIDCMRIQS